MIDILLLKIIQKEVKIKVNLKKKTNHPFYIIGNDKNISLTNRSSYKIKKESLIISKNTNQNNITKEEKGNKKYYSILNNKEFTVSLELSLFDEKYKESYTTICFSETKKCKPGDYEILFDLINNGIIINKNTNETDESKAFTINKKDVEEKMNKYAIIYINSSFYINNYFGNGGNKGESEIILKYKLDKEIKDINFMIINRKRSKNIFINDIKIYNSVTFDIFKNIYIYNQKYLLDDNTVYIDTFEKGDYCEPIKANRKVIINYSCDEEGIYDFKLTKVHEDKKSICVYNYYAKSRFLCNPNYMMKNYLKKSGTKTSCYLDS